MKRNLEKKGNAEVITDPQGRDVDIIRPERQASPFISFRYSYKEVSSDGEKTHIRSKKKSFANGKFQSEEFEGTLPGNLYVSMVTEVQKLFFNQVSSLLNSFSMFLPSRYKDKNR